MSKRWSCFALVVSVVVACGGDKELPTWGDGQLYAPRENASVPETPTAPPRLDAGAIDAGGFASGDAGALDASDDVANAADAAPPSPTATTPPGPPPPMVAPGITTVDVINRGYALALRRVPSDAEVTVWRVEIEHLFVPRISFLHSLVKSQEFPAHYAGLSNPQFAVEVYQTFFHRIPSSGEIDDVKLVLDNNLLSRSDVADYLVSSAEFAYATNPEHPYFF